MSNIIKIEKMVQESLEDIEEIKNRYEYLLDKENKKNLDSLKQLIESIVLLVSNIKDRGRDINSKRVEQMEKVRKHVSNIKENCIFMRKEIKSL